jgi:hypothetical protein
LAGRELLVGGVDARIDDTDQDVLVGASRHVLDR